MIAPDWPLFARRGMEMARLMRWVICAAVVLAFAPSAFADDLDILRGTQTVGPATFPRWSGFYFGGQLNYSSATGEFSKATAPLVGASLAELTLESEVAPSQWPVLGNGSTNTTGFGGFVGYNTQWQDLVLGIEANYTHSPVNMVATSSPILDRVFVVGSNLDSVNLNGTGTMSITDYGSLRARAGLIYGNFLPYGFAGVALGRGNYDVTSLVYGQQNALTATAPILPCNPATVATCVDYSFANSTARSGVLLYGFSVGGGVDVELTSNIFVRAEYEYIQFAPIANITAAISSARVGAGFKF
jgi:outer membrane immunogenic protein